MQFLKLILSFAIVAYAGDLLLLISWHRETDTAGSNLQKMFEAVEIRFNALESHLLQKAELAFAIYLH